MNPAQTARPVYSLIACQSHTFILNGRFLLNDPYPRPPLLVPGPKRPPGVTACAFRVVIHGIENIWSHYADRCGISNRYQAKTFLTTGNVGVKGS